MRSLGVDGDFRMRPEALEAAIVEDRARGLVPFIVVSSAGTTNTGAVDPLDAIADIAAREGLWHHVDGAYGAFFHMCPELRPLLAGLPRADSLTLDPHKGLFLPYGTGALLVRDGEALRAAHAATAGYLPETPDRNEFYDPSEYGPELSRDFRGLRVWLPLSLFGAARFRAALLGEARSRGGSCRARGGAARGQEWWPRRSSRCSRSTSDWPGSTLARRERRHPRSDAAGDGARARHGHGRPGRRALSWGASACWLSAPARRTSTPASRTSPRNRLRSSPSGRAAGSSLEWRKRWNPGRNTATSGMRARATDARQDADPRTDDTVPNF